ncbi:right-handed parallel beta-helix repeat-containing protein [Dactylosporangium sp. NPDC006015]|uniref:right-handed parallel beta-helix repeat-containing protein n=1 Tax=Dactylosporangium sp. NPDC006015 TaxID=3154576 RepID=UPI0033A7CB01
MTRTMLRRRVGFGVVGAGFLALTVVAGLLHTLPAVAPRVLVGTVWLSSRAANFVTLVDGNAAEAAANVAVSAGPAFTVTQLGRTGYVVNPEGGRITSVDSGTLRMSSASPIADAANLALYPAGGALFAVDGARRLAQATDPVTLGRIGSQFQFGAAELLLTTDRLWTLDPRQGKLRNYTVAGTRMDRASGPAITGLTAEQVAFGAAGNEPFIVDFARHRATLPGRGDTVGLPAEAGSDTLVTGSPDRREFTVVQPAAGRVVRCSFDTGDCGTPVQLPGGPADLRAAVEVGRHLFIADHTRQVIHVVDVDTRSVRSTGRLFDTPAGFELVAQDGVLYFNDPGSEHAGVVHDDGGFVPIRKYNPKAPSAPPATQSAKPTAKPSPTRTPTSTPSRTRSVSPSPSPVVRTGALRIERLRITPETPERDETVHIAADVTGGAQAHWQWSIDGAPAGPAKGTGAIEFDHVFTTEGQVKVKLVVAGVATDTAEVTVTVVPPQPPVTCGQVVVADIVLKHDLHCSGAGLTAGHDDILIDLNGKTITGSGTDNGIYIDSFANVTVRNGTVSGFRDGVHLNVTSFVKLVNITSTGNVHCGIDGWTGGRFTELRGGRFDCSRLPTSSNLTAVGVEFVGDVELNQGGSSTFTGCTFRNGGIVSSDAPGFTVTNNRFIDSGIHLNEAGVNTIDHNQFIRGGVSFSIGSARSAVRNNTFTGSAGSALWFDGGSISGTIIEGNTFDANAIGIEMRDDPRDAPAVGLRIASNTFRNNGAAGIDFERLVTGDAALITGNTFEHNGHAPSGRTDQLGYPLDDGFHIVVVGDSQITLTGNTMRNNADRGIEVRQGTVLDGGGNRSTGDPHGCLGITCT